MTGLTFNKQNKGLTLVEAVIGISLFSLVLVGLSGAYYLYLKNSFRLTSQIQATFLAEEGIEALRVIRDTSWSSSFGTFSSGATYYLYWSGLTWGATSTATTVDAIFTRTFKVSSVSRDGSDDITQSGGTNDPNTKKVDVAVYWKTGKSTSTATTTTYFTNLLQN